MAYSPQDTKAKSKNACAMAHALDLRLLEDADGEKKLKRISAFGPSGPVTVVNRGRCTFMKYLETSL